MALLGLIMALLTRILQPPIMAAFVKFVCALLSTVDTSADVRSAPMDVTVASIPFRKFALSFRVKFVTTVPLRGTSR